jgi:hypothetical protein
MRRKTLLLIIVVFVAGLGIASPAGAEPQATDFVCKKCGKPIEGPFFETHGAYYHSSCFVCDDCGRPIKGNYTTYRGGNYHTDCFELNVAKRCSLCDGIIQGEYMFDFWGNAYHLEHRGEIPACEYCGRFIAPQTTGGGVRYSDGRHICNICRKSAVTARNEAMLVLAEVARHMRGFGMDVNIGEVDVHIVGLQEMQKKSGKGSYRLTGFTDFEENKSLFGVTASRRIDIYLLYGMPRIDVVSTMAHELAHVWQFMAGQLNNDTAFSEGSCNYASFLVLLEYHNDEAAPYVIANLQNDNNGVYGEGFRRVKRFAESEGIDEWLERLRKKDTLPEGY